MPCAGGARDLPDRLRAHLDATRLLEGAARVVVACSGGGDSVALLHLLHAVAGARTVLVAAHVSHQLRGGEGDADARFAADAAGALGLPFVLRSVAVRDLRRPSESLEAASRRVRYASLLALSRDLGPGTLVATGHTLDDQAETVLLSLERHLGRSRGGIRARRGDGVVRPLLPFRRAELRTFLEARGEGWREDSSNLDERFARNRVRRRVLPALEELWPGTTSRLARAAEAWSLRLDRLDERIGAALGAAGAGEGGPWPRSLFRTVGEEAAARILLRASGALGRSPGRVQLSRAVARILGPEERFREGIAGGRVEADRRVVRLLPPGTS